MSEPTPEPTAAEQDAAAEGPAADAVESVARPMAELPPLALRLLRIEVPLTVTLASQRASIGEIVELGPGSIVNFEKTCDEPLELSIGNRLIATGEAVKVGDKFGLRIGELVRPKREREPA